VLFLLIGVTPLAVAAGTDHLSRPVFGPRLLLFLLPVLAIVFIARTATIVGPSGVRVRAAFGSRQLAWSSLRGLSVSGRSVYAVIANGSVRLPCVRVADLAEVSRVSEGRLPPIADPVRKYAPSKRFRR
jgi:hypothetical protein